MDRPVYPQGNSMSPLKPLLAGVVSILLIIVAAPTQEPKPPLSSVGSDKEVPPRDEDERVLDAAGVPSEGPGLLELFQARARTEPKPGQIEDLLGRLSGSVQEDRVQASSQLVVLGPIALPGLRRVANDLQDADVREQARRIMTWVEGPQ